MSAIKTIFHCTAGKDSTSVASMLILFALCAGIDAVKNFLFEQYGIDDARINKWLQTYAL